MGTIPYQLLVIDNTTCALLLVKGSTGEILAEMSYPPKFTPTELALAPDGTKAYMPAMETNGTGALFVANLTQRSLYRLPLTLPSPTQFSIAPNGLCAYVSDPDGRLYTLDIATMSLKSLEIITKGACVGLTSDNNAVYSVWEDRDQGSLSSFTPKGELLSHHLLPGIPTNITLDDNGRIFIPFTTIHFNIEGVAFFHRIVTEEQSPAIIAAERCIYPYSTSPSAAYPSHVATWSDEHLAYVVNEESASITVIDSHTAAILRHIEIGRSISCLHILPCGQLGIATSHIFGDLSLIDLKKGRLLSTTNTNRELLGYMIVLPVI